MVGSEGSESELAVPLVVRKKQLVNRSEKTTGPGQEKQLV